MLCRARSSTVMLKDVWDDCVALQVRLLTQNKTKLDEFSMVLLNNTLSLPLIFLLMLYYGEVPGVLNDPALQVSDIFFASLHDRSGASLWWPPFRQHSLLGEKIHSCYLNLETVEKFGLRNKANLTSSLASTFCKHYICAIMSRSAANRAWNMSSLAKTFCKHHISATMSRSAAAPRSANRPRTTVHAFVPDWLILAIQYCDLCFDAFGVKDCL